MGEGSAGLWLAVLASGLYHGISPGMGWPLAVSVALFTRRWAGLFKAMLAIGVGHLAAVGLILLPFTMLEWLVARTAPIRIGAGLLVAAYGVMLLIRRGHPRALARIRPDRLVLWGFVIAIVHGAGLMLVPIYLGLAEHEHLGHGISSALGFRAMLAVTFLHTAAMVASGGTVAWVVYHYLGLQFLRKSWFNLDRLWASSLILIGALGALSALET